MSENALAYTLLSRFQKKKKKEEFLFINIDQRNKRRMLIY
jgi:hypothetical protein